MEKITVNVSWCNKNFAASLGDNVPGAVVFTADSFEDSTFRVCLPMATRCPSGLPMATMSLFLTMSILLPCCVAASVSPRWQR